MNQPIVTLVVLFSLGAAPIQAQQAVSFKNFNQFKGIVSGIDFFASNRQAVVPFEKPAAETLGKLATLLGGNLPKGAIFICTSLEQKDSVYEPRVLRAGYGWALSALTSEARAEETLARIKQQMGGQIPAEVMDRMRNRPPEMRAAAEATMVRSTVRQIALAILHVALAPDWDYRSSRLEDVGRTRLPDWLDIGIASYASGSGANVGFLQQHLEETFPLDDVLGMARPFVAPTSEGGGGGGGVTIRMGDPPSGSGQATPSQGNPGQGQSQAGRGGDRAGGSRMMPKDQQDRMLFDGQASTFFDYLVQKVGIDRIKELIQLGREGKPSIEFIARPDVLGPDFEKIEADWVNWVKAQKPEQNQEFRIRLNPARPGTQPGQFE
jgi:hypothetical protein